jgi:hypothetical protein
MDLKVPIAYPDGILSLMRSVGYYPHSDINTGSDSFIRRLSSRDFYPRFHIYVKERDQQHVLQLHLDQKKPSYAGAHAHSGEYDGEAVEREIARINAVIQNRIAHQAAVPPPPPESSSWFQRLFS